MAEFMGEEGQEVQTLVIKKPEKEEDSESLDDPMEEEAAKNFMDHIENKFEVEVRPMIEALSGGKASYLKGNTGHYNGNIEVTDEDMKLAIPEEEENKPWLKRPRPVVDYLAPQEVGTEVKFYDSDDDELAPGAKERGYESDEVDCEDHLF
jgi:hypothetical protein